MTGQLTGGAGRGDYLQPAAPTHASVFPPSGWGVSRRGRGRDDAGGGVPRPRDLGLREGRAPREARSARVGVTSGAGERAGAPALQLLELAGTWARPPINSEGKLRPTAGGASPQSGPSSAPLCYPLRDPPLPGSTHRPRDAPESSGERSGRSGWGGSRQARPSEPGGGAGKGLRQPSTPVAAPGARRRLGSLSGQSTRQSMRTSANHGTPRLPRPALQLGRRLRTWWAGPR